MAVSDDTAGAEVVNLAVAWPEWRLGRAQSTGICYMTTITSNLPARVAVFGLVHFKRLTIPHKIQASCVVVLALRPSRLCERAVNVSHRSYSVNVAHVEHITVSRCIFKCS